MKDEYFNKKAEELYQKVLEHDNIKYHDSFKREIYLILKEVAKEQRFVSIEEISKYVRDNREKENISVDPIISIIQNS